MTCYLNNKVATDEALDKDGWFHTGDVGKIDANNQVWITDRLKDVMKVKGYEYVFASSGLACSFSKHTKFCIRFQVSPSELENLLCGSSSVADAAVTGVFDASLATELPRAYVVPSSKQLLAQCTQSNEITPELKALAAELKQLIEEKTVRYKW